MKCSKCGTEVSSNANFCRVCGSSMELEKQKNQDSTSSESLAKSDTVLETKGGILSDTSELFFGRTNSSKKIKQILDEMTPEERNPEEPTMAIPSDLIMKYSKNNSKKEDKKDDKKEEVKEEPKKEDKPTITEPIKEEKKEDIKKEEKVEPVIEKVEEKKEEIKVEVPVNKVEEKEEEKVVVPEIPKLEPKKEEKLDKTTKINQVINQDKKVEETKEEKITEDEEKDDNKNVHYGRGFFTFFIILICLCSIGYLVYVLYGSRNELEKVTEENNKLQDELNVIKSGNSKEGSSDSFLFNGYRFNSISKNISVTNDSLVINMDDTTYVVKISSINYEDIKTKKDEYKNKLVSLGYTILSYGNKHVDNTDYYVFEVSDSSKNKYLIAYSSLDKTDSIAFIISNKSNTIDYNLLSKTNLIISSASKENDIVTTKYDVFVEKK